MRTSPFLFLLVCSRTSGLLPRPKSSKAEWRPRWQWPLARLLLAVRRRAYVGAHSSAGSLQSTECQQTLLTLGEHKEIAFTWSTQLAHSCPIDNFLFTVTSVEMHVSMGRSSVCQRVQTLVSCERSGQLSRRQHDDHCMPHWSSNCIPCRGVRLRLH